MIINNLSVEHFVNGTLGIPMAAPRLSWNYSEEVPDDAHVDMTIIRRLPGENKKSEKVAIPAGENILHPWPVSELASREEVSISVKLVSSNHEDLSEESDILHFEVGLLHEYEHVADFVGPSWVEGKTDHRHLPLVRSEVELLDYPKRARLYLSALGLVEAEINGVKVGNDTLAPGWTNYKERVNCWTYDVTDQLQKGANALGFWLGDGWYRGRLGFDGGYANYYGDKIGVFAQLEIEYPDGVIQHVYSNSWDRQWKCALGPIVCSDLCEGERYDARLESDGWSLPGFDDSQWEPVSEIFYNPAQIQNPETSPVRPHEIHQPVSLERIRETADGRGTWLVDFGQNCTQRIRLHITGLKAGDSVDLHHVEVLEPNGDIATRTLRRGQQHDTYISNGSDAWWEPRFTMHGFRYAQIEGIAGELTTDDMECRVYHSVMTPTGTLETSDPLVNRLHENAVWSMRSNFVSIPTDCPQRDERMGWTGDICLFAPTATYLHDVYGFLKSWLKDMRSDQKEWGTIPFYVPFIPLGVWSHPQAISTWGDAAVEVPWTLYMESGDSQILEETYELSRDWVEEVSQYLSADGVWDRKPGFLLGQLGDWLDPSAPPGDPTQAMTEKELVATAFFARSCDQMQKIASILHKDDDSAHYELLKNRVISGFRARFVRSDGTMTSDTQCAYALAIAFGLLQDVPEIQALAGNRLAELVRESGGKISTGFAGTPFVLPSLTLTGHDREAYELLMSRECPSWLYQVSMGATTTWERWDSMRPDGSLNPGGMTSFNHYALGSVAEWLHAHIGGLEALEVGWKRFRVAPSVGYVITHASTSHMTPFGLAKVSWQADEDIVSLSVTVPSGTTAVIDIPGQEPREVTSGEHQYTFSL